jgi:hypothetical protein
MSQELFIRNSETFGNCVGEGPLCPIFYGKDMSLKINYQDFNMPRYEQQEFNQTIFKLALLLQRFILI